MNPSSSISLSATNSMYCFISSQFIPISFTGRASVRNSCRQRDKVRNRRWRIWTQTQSTKRLFDPPVRSPRRSWWWRWRFLWTACSPGVWTSDRRSHSVDPETSKPSQTSSTTTVKKELLLDVLPMNYVIIDDWWRFTSSLLISSLEKVRPGIRPLFFSQKMAAKEPEKKIPSTAANATTRSPGSSTAETDDQ